MDLVRDFLDLQVRDGRFRKCGRVDGVVLEIRADAPPRLAAIEMGGAVLARRVHPRALRWYRRLAAWLGIDAAPVRIDMAHVSGIDLNVTLDLDAKTNADLLRVERWIARRFHRSIDA